MSADLCVIRRNVVNGESNMEKRGILATAFFLKLQTKSDFARFRCGMWGFVEVNHRV